MKNEPDTPRNAATGLPVPFVDPVVWCAGCSKRWPMASLSEARLCPVCLGKEPWEVPDAPLVALEMPPNDSYVRITIRREGTIMLMADDFDSPAEWANVYAAAAGKLKDRAMADSILDEVATAYEDRSIDDNDLEVDYAQTGQVAATDRAVGFNVAS